MKLRRLLVANRGEIARRVIRTAHRMGIETVAVYAEPDAGALHVREATRAHALGGAAAADSYLRIDKLLAAARAGGADAVHPGYGFLSENAEFAQAVADAGLVWIGPPAAAIRALGNKAAAKRLAGECGVPCLPGYHGAEASDERLAAEAQRIGWPVMVKAAAGGGGRGMRLVREAGQLPAALQGARAEAQAAFGSGELLLERALLAPRHVEVQVFADAHGHCIHLGERDCSVQRRHQKLIEEAPSPAVDAALRERMGRCAVSLAKAAGYVGAGTVEFLLEAGEFWFLEVNTRLQVEHPVTEALTGLDLVEWQLRVAQGEPLPLAQQDVRLEGHAIEVRLCAEDDAFHPQAGRVLHFLPPPAPSLRFDHAIFPGLRVSPHYDSMLGKLIAHAPTRAAAIDHLAEALDRTELLGVPTNRRLLAACLRHPAFRAGEALVPFLDRQGDALREELRGDEAAVARDAALAALLPRGPSRVLPLPFARPLRLRHRGELLQLDLCESGLRDCVAARVARVAPHRFHVQVAAVDLLLDDASFDPPASAAAAAGANEVRAPFNGRVIAVKAQPGDTVSRGEPLVVLESMKLEHAITAARDAVVRAIHVQPGQQAATAQLLVTLEAAA